MLESNKRRKTKAIIERAMVSLLHKQSFDHITTVQLAQAAGISRSSFYTHYKDKYDMIERYQQNLFHQLGYIFENNQEDIQTAITEVFQFLQLEPLLAALLTENGTKEIQNFLRHKLQVMLADSLQDQITQLERLSTLQQRFVSDVSHELRTPLSTVRLSSELLYDSRDTLNPVQSRSVELMHNQVDRFQALLSDLLEISRFDAGSAVLNIDAEDFMSVLNDVLVEVIPHLERTGTRLIVHSEQAHIDIDIDRVRIERVLRNLLFNAIEHGESKPVDIYIATNATNLGVAVRDHGIGLSEEEAAQVFNRFWRADTSRKRTLGGTGLGLSITAEDVRLHGGRIEAWGMKGKGACFTMNLPLVHGGELGPSPVLITGEPEPEAYAHSALAGDTLSTSLRKTRHATQDDASEGQV